MKTRDVCRFLLFVATPACMATPLVGQVPGLQPGVAIRVTRVVDRATAVRLETVTGTVVAADSRTMLVSVSGEAQLLDISGADVVRLNVQRPVRHLRYRGARIGAGAGALVGLLVGFLNSGDNCLGSAPSCRMLGVAAGAVAGGLGGGTLGFALGSALHRDEWRSVPVPATVRAGRILSLSARF